MAPFSQVTAPDFLTADSLGVGAVGGAVAAGGTVGTGEAVATGEAVVSGEAVAAGEAVATGGAGCGAIATVDSGLVAIGLGWIIRFTNLRFGFDG